MKERDDISSRAGGDAQGGGHRPLPAERVFSFVATLLESSRPLTRDEILDRLSELYVPHGFPEPGPETLRKMFERDKRLVKEMGVPLVTVEPGQPGSEEIEEGVIGYRIDESDLHVPEISLDDGQRVLLLAMAQTLLGSPDFPLREDLAMAVHKVLLASGGGRARRGQRLSLPPGARRRKARNSTRSADPRRGGPRRSSPAAKACIELPRRGS